jgi:chromosome segregation ATPase
MYMKVKDPKWGRAVETVLGKSYTNFLVENFDDRDVLFRILEKSNCP